MATGMYSARDHPEPGQSLQRIHLVRESGPLPPPIHSAADVVPLIRAHLDKLHREAFFVIPLNSKHRPLGLHMVSLGTPTSSLVHPREAFLPAILAGAVSLVAVHDHPSGDPTPSPEDREVTNRLQEVGELLGISLLDHIVMGARTFFSFAAEQELPIPD